MRIDEMTPTQQEQRQLVIEKMLGAGFWQHWHAEGVELDVSETSFEYEPEDDDDAGMMLTYEAIEGYLDYVVSFGAEHARAAIYFEGNLSGALDEILRFKANADSVEQHILRLWALCPRTELWDPATDDYLLIATGEGIEHGRFQSGESEESEGTSWVAPEPGPRGEFVMQCIDGGWDPSEHEELRRGGIEVEPDALAEFLGLGADRRGVAASLGYDVANGLMVLTFGVYGEEGLTFHFYVDETGPLVEAITEREDELPVDPADLPDFMAAVMPFAKQTVFLGPEGPVEFKLAE